MRKNLDGGLLHAMHAFLKVIDSGVLRLLQSRWSLQQRKCPDLLAS